MSDKKREGKYVDDVKAPRANRPKRTVPSGDEAREAKAAKRPAPATRFRIGFKCGKAGGMVYHEPVEDGVPFKCPSCGSELTYTRVGRTFTSSGSVLHQLQKLVEIGTAA